MDYATARQLIACQQIVDRTETLLGHLRQGKPPIPGQVTSLLLALKVIYERHANQPTLDRELVTLLHQLAWESRIYLDNGTRAGVAWPPLLADDLGRVAAGVQGIFAGVWPNIHQR